MTTSTSRLCWRLATVLLVFGCASANVSGVRDYGSEGAPRPPVVLVYDVAVSPEDVPVDTAGPAFASNGGDSSEKAELGRRVSRMLNDGEGARRTRHPGAEHCKLG